MVTVTVAALNGGHAHTLNSDCNEVVNVFFKDIREIMRKYFLLLTETIFEKK